MTVPHTPIESRTGGVPPWAILLAALLLLLGGFYVATNLTGENPAAMVPGQTPPPADGEPDPAVGAQLVQSAGCTACHGADLGGSGAFPPLQGLGEGPHSDNLQDLAAEHPDDWIHLWIDGTTPETEGIDRRGMPQFGDQLSPEQIESIVAYLLTQ